MLNYIWAFMILIGIVYASFTGNMAAVSQAVLDSAKEAVALCVTMLGVMSLWIGMMEVARAAGLIEQLAKGLRPCLRLLFPRLPKEHKAVEPISINLISNILGLGWAATPAGLQAMEALAELEQERGNPEYSAEEKPESQPEKQRKGKRQGMGGAGLRGASDEMCTFLIINISSLQLIPVNIIAYRSQYGSVNPAAIVGPGLAATLFSTIVAVVYCRMRCSRRRQ